MKVRECVGRALRDAGIKRVFGVPGGEVTDLAEGFRSNGIEFVLTRHEAAAAFMASATGTLTGVPGVCVATLGPGATNLVSGVAQSYLDRSPMIVFTGQLPGWRLGSATHQVLDLQALFSPITKWRYRLEPKQTRESIQRAILTAKAERPGPVYVEVPSDVCNMEAEEAISGSASPLSRFRTDASEAADCLVNDSLPADRLSSSYNALHFPPEGIADAASQLLASRRPVMLAGLSAARAGATAGLVGLADLIGLPVIVTPQAKGVFPEDHPAFMGTLEMLATSHLFELIRDSDFIIAVGLDPVELMGTWPAKPGIYLDRVPNLEQYYTCSVNLVGPIVEGLGALNERLARVVRNPSFGGRLIKWTAEELAERRRSLDAAIPASGEGLYAKELFQTMNRVLPDSTIVTCDVGAHKFATGQLWKARCPGSFLMSNGLSSMGYALPSAIAAKLVHPGRPVVTVVGDGGLAMYAGELDTARRLGAGVIVVVCADRALSLIRMNQKRKGYPSYGTEFDNPDWVKVASGMGFRAVSCESQADVEEALNQALKWDGPFLIEARVNPLGYETT